MPICSIRPSLITTIRSDSESASSWSWVTYTVVIPSWRWIARISFRERDPDLGVEGRQRLVQQEDLGLDRQGPGERHALLLAARQLPRVAVALVGQVDQLEQLADPLA